MNKNIGNQKAQKSQKAIVNAILQLLKEMPFEQITVKAITDKAKLSRRTFYRNFSNKTEIIDELILGIWQDYLDEIKKKPDYKLYNVVYTFFNVVVKHQEMLEILHNQGLLISALNKVNEHLPLVLKVQIRNETTLSNSDASYLAAFIGGGMISLVIEWFDQGAQEAPAAIAANMGNLKYIYQDKLMG